LDLIQIRLYLSVSGKADPNICACINSFDVLIAGIAEANEAEAQIAIKSRG